MNLLIKLTEDKIILELRKGSGILADKEWVDSGNTSQELLVGIDNFLQDNHLKVQDLQSVKAEIDEKQKYTLGRIVKITADTLDYCLREEQNQL